MRIGIDFDNTIAKYDLLFQNLFQGEKVESKSQIKTKSQIKNFLLAQKNGEKKWMTMQGKAYGKYMHQAEIMPNLVNFLISARIRHYKIFIVSHKTEYGHFDKEKISLRSEAIKWMEKNRFFNKDFICLDKKNIFFADTRKDKVDIISNLSLDWFIDDLPEVFLEEFFPNRLNKILFSKKKLTKLNNIYSINNWTEIFQKIIGNPLKKDIILWLRFFSKFQIDNISKVKGKGNSIIYKLKANNKNYAAKIYPDILTDKRPRLLTECKTLATLKNNNFDNVPSYIDSNKELNIGIFEWISGSKIKKQSRKDINEAVKFVKDLFSLSKKIEFNCFQKASEACISAKDLAFQIDSRIFALNKLKTSNQELCKFISSEIEPFWTKIRSKFLSLWPKESRSKDLPINKMILSPSDFGFHNCIKKKQDSLYFLDFEYFGWDDPVKLTSDFLWHPAMNLSSNNKRDWILAMKNLFSEDNYFEQRLKIAMPIFGLRWSLIMLNEFFPKILSKRKSASNINYMDVDLFQQTQLKKSKNNFSLSKKLFLKL